MELARKEKRETNKSYQKEQNQFVCNCNLSPMFTKDRLKRLTGLTWRSKHK